jgi:hypothetical protein
MTIAKPADTGAAVPQPGQPLALAALCTLLFLTFLDNTIVGVGLGSVQSDRTRACSPCNGSSERVVPITSSVLGSVPPQRSGMAASAASTSREIGAVTGVAILGALVNAQLHADLTGKLTRLGIPAKFQSIVVNAIETGGVPPSGHGSPAGGAGNAKIVQEVIQAAYHAFEAGLHAALYLSAGLVIGAAILTVITLRSSARSGRQHRTAPPG